MTLASEIEKHVRCKDKEYRITRSDLYNAVGCTGFSDLNARNGHYLRGRTPIEALMRAVEKFPGENLTCQDWDYDGNHGKRVGGYDAVKDEIYLLSPEGKRLKSLNRESYLQEVDRLTDSVLEAWKKLRNFVLTHGEREEKNSVRAFNVTLEEEIEFLSIMPVLPKRGGK